MQDKINDLRAAVANLVKVAHALHTPLDTSTVEAAMAALEAATKRR